MKRVIFIIFLFLLCMDVFGKSFIISLDGEYVKPSIKIIEDDKYLVSPDFLSFLNVDNVSAFEEDFYKDTGLYDLDRIIGRMGTDYDVQGMFVNIHNKINNIYFSGDKLIIDTLFKTDFSYKSNGKSFSVNIYGKNINYSFGAINIPKFIKSYNPKQDDFSFRFSFETRNKVLTKDKVINTDSFIMDLNEIGITNFVTIEDINFVEAGEDYKIILKNGAMVDISADMDLYNGIMTVNLNSANVENEILGKFDNKVSGEIFKDKIVFNLEKVTDISWEAIGDDEVITLFTPKSVGKSLDQIKVVIDPGHGGSDKGAGRNDVWEKEINYYASLAIKEVLESEGVTVYLTRELEENPSLKERGQLAIDNNCDFFLSVHSNSTEGEDKASGYENYYHKNLTGSKYFAYCIHDYTVLNINIPDRGIRSDQRLYSQGLGVLRSASTGSVPCSLIEMGFINHSVDREMLQSEDFRKEIAMGVLRGIEYYLSGMLLSSKE